MLTITTFITTCSSLDWRRKRMRKSFVFLNRFISKKWSSTRFWNLENVLNKLLKHDRTLVRTLLTAVALRKRRINIPAKTATNLTNPTAISVVRSSHPKRRPSLLQTSIMEVALSSMRAYVISLDGSSGQQKLEFVANVLGKGTECQNALLVKPNPARN